MIKILIIAIVIIVIAVVYSLCIMSSRDDIRRERDARKWDDQKGSDVLEYSLNKYRYHELKYLCLQFKDITRQAKEGKEAAVQKYKAITHAAVEAREDISKYILEAVTEGKKWEQLEVPCGRRQFYIARRRFYWLLDKYV